MSRLHQFIFTCVAAAAVHLPAQTPPIFPGQTNTNFSPPMPQFQSPVTFFRQLLLMTTLERNNSLSSRPPEARAKILAKVREYQVLGPNERELRLRATELRWYLTPLLRLPAEQREARLASIPENYRALVRQRLGQWSILPPALQQEFLTNDQPVHYFAHVATSDAPAASAVSQKLAAQFDRFFELTPAEKNQTLGSLSPAERAEMEKTLQTFEKLPPRQRLQCLRNYATFVGMSATERAEFLKNAGRWAQLTPAERQAWRDLVAHVPAWTPMPAPPIPAAIYPPPLPAHSLRPGVATN